MPAAGYREQYRDHPDMKPTECKCPLCERKHTYTLLWIGRGVPRVYCPQCRQKVGEYER